jgi:hypothetical protein
MVLAGALTIAEVRAQPVGVEAIANYTGADRQRILEAGARREGSLLLYTTQGCPGKVMDSRIPIGLGRGNVGAGWG